MPRTETILFSMAGQLAGKTCCRTLRKSPTAIAAFSSATGGVPHDPPPPPPFYGSPRPPSHTLDQPRSIPNRLAVAIHYATTAFSDPTRADAVAALGEITGPITLQRIANQMKRDEVGKRILKDRPIVSKATIPYDKFIQEAPVVDSIDGMDVTFGQAYGFFLKSHDFDPDERDEVRFVEDEEQAYIMLRYRQVRT